MDSKILEIPFGAKDSELIEWSYTISEGMEAEIKDGKVIIRKKESEDERIRKEIIGYLNNRVATAEETELLYFKRWIAYLEKQKEQKPAEWSEEDKETLEKLHRLLVISRGEKKFIPSDEYDKLDNWLKSLRPKPHWKPSREQMESLYNAVVRCKACSNTVHLPELYEDLKTL